MQAGKCRKVSVNSLPKSIRADGIGKRLTLLLRHDDDKITWAQFIYRQIQHDPCAECCVQAKIYGLIVGQLPGQQSAVNAESGCTAAKNKTRFIAFRGQQVAGAHLCANQLELRQRIGVGEHTHVHDLIMGQGSIQRGAVIPEPRRGTGEQHKLLRIGQ